MQVCPELENFAFIRPSTAKLTSASSKIIKGACPPNSIETAFIVFADFSNNDFPTGVEPVKLIFLTFVLSVILSPIFLALPITKLTTPLGKLAFSKHSNTLTADKGVAEAGLRITVHPAAKAGAIFLVIIENGKFHGVIAAHTPIGFFVTIKCLFEWEGGKTSPYIRLVSSAYHSIYLIPLSISLLASLSGFPFSLVTNFAKFS